MASKHQKVPVEVKKLIIKLNEEGKSYGEISKIIDRPRSTVQSVVINFKNNASFGIAPGRGRKKKFDERCKRKIERMVKIDPKISATKIVGEIRTDLGISVSAQTVRNYLHEQNYRGCVARKKPYLSLRNVDKRLAYAKQYESKSDEFWEKVLFVDESKFNIFGSDGRRFVWRRVNTALEEKNIRPTIKHGSGSIMVWGAMGANGVGNLVFIETTMDKHMYLDVLKNNLKESATKAGLPSDFLLVQDNDPKHSTEIVKLWLLYNVKSVLPHPPQSPDLNPIEHLWDVLEKKLRVHQISNKSQLKEAILEEWTKISPDVTKKLVLSMKSRLREVIAVKGRHTRY